MASVSWGPGRGWFRGRRDPKDHSQLTNEERKQRGLPHDGYKQAEKDRRRRLFNEDYFDSGMQRAGTIVTRVGDL